MVDDLHIPSDVETNSIALRNVLTLIVERLNVLSNKLEQSEKLLQIKSDPLVLTKVQVDLEDPQLIDAINTTLTEIEDAINSSTS